MPPDPTSEPKNRGTARFQLTRSFAMVAGLVLVLAALLLSGFHWYWSLNAMEKMAEQNNVNVARLLANVLWSRNGDALQRLSAADPATLKRRPEIDMLHDEIGAFILNAQVSRVKIYDRQGHTIFSTEREQIGEDESDDEGFQSALAGKVKSELARAHTFSATESTTVDTDLLSSYVPIHGGPSGTDVVGVFEVYDDVSAFLADINRGLASQVALVLLTAGGVYLVLIWYVRRGDLLLREQHENALALAQAVARTEAASKAKSQFLANMSHELRTPLNAVIGFADMLGAEGLGPLGDKRYVGYAREIGESGRNLLGIVNNTLDLAKIELGTAEISPRPVDPKAVVDSALHALERPIAEAGVAVSAEIDPATPVLETDEGKLRQILVNLLSNAVKFTPAGGRVAIRVGGIDARQVRFEIRDSGIGIKPEDVPLALAPFGQVESALNRRYQGAGLGLPLAKGLAELLGGRLDIAGSPGAGTVVGVTIAAAGQ